MYVVTSYDFGGTSDVKLHVVTDRLELAQEVYAKVKTVCESHNAGHLDDGTKMLVELTHVDQDTPLLGADARVLFWGSGGQNNNSQ